MNGWSTMLPEILDDISDRLDSRSDVVRFRSVCASWRSAVPPGKRLFPAQFPILPNDGISDFSRGFCLSKRSVFLLSLPHYPPCQADPLGRGSSWLIKVKEDIPKQMVLLNPLSRAPFAPFPDDFPRIIDTSMIRVRQLASEYVMQYMNSPPLMRYQINALNIYMEKVVFLGSNCSEFVVLTIHVSGKLAVFKSGDKNWSIISDMPSPYDDVIMFEDKFYAVDGTGRAVNVGLDLNLTEVAGPTFGGDKKFLVESLGELLLADMYFSEYEIQYEDRYGVEIGDIVTERTLKFKVYKLDRTGQQWVDLKDLGDRVLFLGEDCTFSASSSDLKACKGNCIFFTGEFQDSIDDDHGDGIFHGRDIGVYDLETGHIGPLDFYIGYSDLFWPPPGWIGNLTSRVNDQLELLAP